jgi:hypothetical protein
VRQGIGDRVLRGRGLTAAVGVAAALPVIVATIRALAAGWVPVADQGTIASRAYAVLGSHTPLLGQYTFASRVAGHVTHDLGPLLYWLLAVPARVGGAPALTATMGAANTAAIVGSVALARRRGGVALMAASGAALALMAGSFGVEAIHGIWNPAAGLFPLTLLAFLCWSLACGEHRLLPLAVVVASFAMQCHLAYVAPSAALLVVGIAGCVLARRSSWRGGARGGGSRRALVRWSLAAVLTAVACWSAPVVEQVTSSPGNLALVARAATAGGPAEGGGSAWRALAHAVGAAPRWLQAPQAEVADRAGRPLGWMSGGDYGDTRLADVGRAPGVIRAGTCGLVLAGLLVLLLVGARRRRADVLGAAASALALCGTFAWMVAATPVSARDTLGYSLWWGSIVGMWSWLVLAWSLAPLGAIAGGAVARRLSALAPARGPALGLGALGAGAASVALAAGTGLAVAVAERADAHAPDFALVRALSRRLEGAVRPGELVAVVRSGTITAPLQPALEYELRSRGVRILENRYGASPLTPSRAQLRRCDYELVLSGRPAGRPAGPVEAAPRRASPDSRTAPRAGAVLATLTLPPARWLPGGGGGAHLITIAAIPRASLVGGGAYAARSPSSSPAASRSSSPMRRMTI